MRHGALDVDMELLEENAQLAREYLVELLVDRQAFTVDELTRVAALGLQLPLLTHRRTSLRGQPP